LCKLKAQKLISGAMAAGFVMVNAAIVLRAETWLGQQRTGARNAAKQIKT
jgi:hypothetical protein